MKKDLKKQSLTKNESKYLFTNADQMFSLYCDGVELAKIAKRFGHSVIAVKNYSSREKWGERRKEILDRVRNDINEQIKIQKVNQAKMGLMIKKLNTKKMVKEYEAYQKKGRIPSFVGHSTKTYQENLHLADILMETDQTKVDVSVNGKVNHDVRNFSPDQIDRILDSLCDFKGIPRSPLPDEPEVITEVIKEES